MSERYCILCVDADVSGLEARAALLEEEGYSVTCVSCPLRAVESDATKFHLAVLDFAKPSLNGCQLLLRLRAAHSSRVAQRHEPGPSEQHAQSVLKLSRQRKTDRSLAQYQTFLPNSEPGPTRVLENGQRCSASVPGAWTLAI
jgi:CheY-like chemotaxis protein